MKVCPLCGENYKPFVDFCFVDGEVLTVEQAVEVAPEPEGFDAPPPPKMLQGSQQSSGYTRSATPVPRARRPGRSLIGRQDSGGGVYSPPAEDAPAVPAVEPAPVASANLEADEEEVLEAPPTVEEVATFDDDFAGEPEPEPFFPDQQQRARTPTPDPSPRQQRTPPPPAPVDYDPGEDEPEESGTVGLVFIGLGAIVLIGVVGAIGALAVGTIFAGSQDDDPEVVKLPEPPIEPVPTAPVQDPEPVEPIEVGKVDPEPVEPEPVEDPEPVEPEPVEDPQPVEPDPVPVVDPQPVPSPNPNDAVAVISPRPVGQTGTVVFTSDPDRATIFLDGTAIGTTRFSSTVPYGQHDLELRKEGYESVKTKFNLSVPELTLSTYTLTSLTPEPEPAPVTPRPAGTPRKVMFFHTASVSVKVNGSTEGCDGGGECMAPATYHIPPGTYTVEFDPGSGPKTCRVTIADQESVQLMKLHQLCP